MEKSELRTVPFHGDQIVTFESEGVHYVAMRRIVENMGLAWQRQSAKLLEQKEKFSCNHMVTVGADGKERQMLSMPVEKLPLWLASINPAKVKDEAVRAKVERYQAESAIALHDYWTKGAAIRPDVEVSLTPAVLGAVFKGVARKQAEDIISAFTAGVDKLIDAERDVYAKLNRIEAKIVAPALEAPITAQGVVKSLGVQRVRGLVQRVSRSLQRFHRRRGVPVREYDIDGRALLLFDRQTARKWVRAGGKRKILEYVAAKLGSNVVALVPKDSEK